MLLYILKPDYHTLCLCNQSKAPAQYCYKAVWKTFRRALNSNSICIHDIFNPPISWSKRPECYTHHSIFQRNKARSYVLS